MKKLLPFLFICLLFVTNLVRAQQRTITGTVLLASDATPAAGVTVAVVAKTRPYKLVLMENSLFRHRQATKSALSTLVISRRK